jgi:hypothetical protein
MSESLTLKEFITLLGFKTDTSGLTQYDQALQNTFKKAEELNHGIKMLADKIISFGSRVSLFLTTPIVGFGVASVMAQDKLEDMRKEWEVLLGSAEEGRNLVETVEQLEEKQPFKTEQILAYLKHMRELGVEERALLPTFRKYSDIAAGTGTPVDMMITRFSMMHNMAKEMGYVMGRDITGLVRRGILSRGEMLSLLGVSDIRKIPSQIRMSTEQVDRLLNVLGGKYSGSAERRAQTTAKAFENLWHAIFKLRAAVGEVIVKKLHLNGVLKTLTELLERATSWVEKLSDSKKGWILTTLGLLAVLGPAITSMGLLIKGFAMIRGAMMIGAAGAAATGWIALITAGIIGLLFLFDDIAMWFTHGAEASFYGEAIEGAFKKIKGFIDDLWLWFTNGIDTTIEYFKNHWQDALKWFEYSIPGFPLIRKAVELAQSIPGKEAGIPYRNRTCEQDFGMGAGAGLAAPGGTLTIGEINVTVPNADPATIDYVKKAVHESATSVYDGFVKRLNENIYRHVKQ